MKILFLGYKDNKIQNFLLNEGVKLLQTDKKITLEEIKDFNPDFIVSYGYSYIIKDKILSEYKNKIINLHISYLPWNRGAYPNIWSVIDNTPKGVTIHFIDEGVDTGDILFQKQIEFDEQETLFSSYCKLRQEIEDLFIDNWLKIKNFDFSPTKQDKTEGTFHLKKTSRKYFDSIGILDKWEMNIGELMKRSDEEIINEIQKIREKNNTHWMDIVKLSFRLSPVESREIFKKIKFCDEKINNLLKQLSENE